MICVLSDDDPNPNPTLSLIFLVFNSHHINVLK